MNPMTRRASIQQLGALAALGALPLAHAQAPIKVRIGYLHVLSVDAHLLLGQHLGSWKKEGLEVELREFNSGVELFQALIGGSLDVLTTGGVLSNFPARGQGKVFLLNDVEWKVGQVWVDPSITSIAELKGKKIATTLGTTAHDLLYHGLKSVGLASKDVQLVNQRMNDAVTSFIAGAVPAVATWVPFNQAIIAKRPSAKKLFDGADFPDAAIVDGWAANNSFYENHKDVLARIVRAWIPANNFLIASPEEAKKILHDKYYSDLTKAAVDEMYNAARFYSIADWVRYYTDGTAIKWLNRVTDFNVVIGSLENPIMADKYFDPSIFLQAANNVAR